MLLLLLGSIGLTRGATRQTQQLLAFKEAFTNGGQVLFNWVDDPSTLAPECSNRWKGIQCNKAMEVTSM